MSAATMRHLTSSLQNKTMNHSRVSDTDHVQTALQTTEMHPYTLLFLLDSITEGTKG